MVADQSRKAARTDVEETAAPGGADVFHFEDADFERVRKLIYQHAGITLSDSKRTMVYSRLVRRLRALGESDFSSYLRRVQNGDGPEWQNFVNSLTTNLTSFYREAHHFKILARHLEAQPAQSKKRIWCAAASTGEEPYTIAFTAIEALGSSNPAVEIVASDIDTSVLARAEQATYPLDTVAKMEPERLKHFFLRGKGTNEGLVRVKPEVRCLVTFKQLNLLDSRWPLEGPFTAIFCRNVMIYFDKETQLKLARRLAALLAPDGLIFFGHSENLSQVRDVLESCGQTVYKHANAR